VATLSVLSMPPGEGCQVLSTAGQTWLLDCGGVQHHRRNLLPFLRREDVARIDGLVLSHADADHAGAAVKLVESWGSPRVLASAHEPWRLDSRVTALWQLHSALASCGREMESLGAGDRRQLGQVTMQVLYPTDEDKHDKADDRALVARFDCGGFRVLWCNDAGFAAEKALLERWSAAGTALPCSAAQPARVGLERADGILERRATTSGGHLEFADNRDGTNAGALSTRGADVRACICLIKVSAAWCGSSLSPMNCGFPPGSRMKVSTLRR